MFFSAKRTPMKSLFTFVLVCLSAAVFGQAQATLNKNIHNFGTFKEGADSVCVFTITNTGNQPLIIISVSKPCGCTTPDYSREPIMPGKTGTVTVKYASQDHPGKFIKNLQVKTNDPVHDVVTITITGEVIPKDTDIAPSKPAEVGGRSGEVK